MKTALVIAGLLLVAAAVLALFGHFDLGGILGTGGAILGGMAAKKRLETRPKPTIPVDTKTVEERAKRSEELAARAEEARREETKPIDMSPEAVEKTLREIEDDR